MYVTPLSVGQASGVSIIETPIEPRNQVDLKDSQKELRSKLLDQRKKRRHF